MGDKTGPTATKPPVVPAPPVWAADVDRRARLARNSAVIASTLVSIVIAAIAIGLFVLLRERPVETVVTPSTGGTLGTANNSMRVEYQEYQWQRGAAPVRMIRKEEGFCYLTRVSGEFAGMGEQARVYIESDGYWYLHGSSFKPLGASAMSVRFVSRPFASASFPAKEKWTETLARLEASEDSQVRAVAKAEHDGPPEDAMDRARFADLWNSASEKVANVDRAALVSHAIHLYETSTGVGPVTAASVAAKLNRLRQNALNDLTQWKRQTGKWDVSPDGKIRGLGDAAMMFTHQLPRDCSLELHLNVVEGMRPRIRFLGTDFYVGNEGYDQVIAPYGAVSSQGTSTRYGNNEEIKLGIKFVGEKFELSVNDAVTARGTRKTPPETVGLRIEAGDFWSAGDVLFWGFKLTPATGG